MVSVYLCSLCTLFHGWWRICEWWRLEGLMQSATLRFASSFHLLTEARVGVPGTSPRIGGSNDQSTGLIEKRLYCWATTSIRVFDLYRLCDNQQHIIG